MSMSSGSSAGATAVVIRAGRRSGAARTAAGGGYRAAVVGCRAGTCRRQLTRSLPPPRTVPSVVHVAVARQDQRNLRQVRQFDLVAVLADHDPDGPRVLVLEFDR